MGHYDSFYEHDALEEKKRIAKARKTNPFAYRDPLEIVEAKLKLLEDRVAFQKDLLEKIEEDKRKRAHSARVNILMALYIELQGVSQAEAILKKYLLTHGISQVMLDKRLKLW